MPYGFAEKIGATGARDVTAGRELEQQYVDQATSFDPAEAVATSTRGAFNGIRRDIDVMVERLRGEQVGMGRLKSGYGTDDEDHVVTGQLDRLNDIIASNSLAATRMKMENFSNLGAFGANQVDRGIQQQVSGEEARLSEENARRAERSAKRSGFGAALGTIAGIGVSFIPGLQPLAPALISGGGRIGAGLFQ